MKALSIRQPWAWAILHGGKDVENRTWKTSFRGRILIHAGKKFDHEGSKWLCWDNGNDPTKLPLPDSYKMGGIVGSVEIVDCVTNSNSGWFFGPYGLVLRNPKPLEFYPCPGRLKFFDVEYPKEVE